MILRLPRSRRPDRSQGRLAVAKVMAQKAVGRPREGERPTWVELARQDLAGGIPLAGGVLGASVYSLTGASAASVVYAGPK